MLRAEAHQEKGGGGDPKMTGLMRCRPALMHNIYTQSSMKSEQEIGVESQYWETQTGGIRS